VGSVEGLLLIDLLPGNNRLLVDGIVIELCLLIFETQGTTNSKLDGKEA
jgi:hypothetical protein